MWYVPVFCFGWVVVKKLRFEKTLVGVVLCASENWVALLLQDSLVLCSVKCIRAARLGRSSSDVWVRARARAPRRCCIDPFGARARARTQSAHTTQRNACTSSSANRRNQRQHTGHHRHKLQKFVPISLAFVPPPTGICTYQFTSIH